MTRQPGFFFTKTAVTGERKVKKSFPGWEMNGLSKGYKRAVDQNWGRMAKKNWPKLLLTPRKIRIFGTKTAKFGLKLAFSPNIGYFGPYFPMADLKTMQRRCVGGFSLTLLPKLLLASEKIRIFGPKIAKFGPKIAFLVIWAKHWHFWPISSHAGPKYNANKGLGGFSVV